jgi:hypothetical protein
MRNLSLVFLLVCLKLSAATYTSISTGDWSNDAIWSSAPSDNDCTPAGNNTYNINHYVSSSCVSLSFTGTVVINVASGATFYLSGSGGISGSVTLNIATGGAVIVVGNLNLGGSSDVTVNGSLTVNGSIIGVGSSFDCNGSTNGGSVTVGGTGCSNCTNSGDAGCNQNVPLPVNVSAFDAVNSGNNVNVFWTTSYEKDNDHFIVERSNDGITYVAVHTLQAELNSNTSINYTFEDNGLSSGTYYYRLVQIDVDGAKTRTDAVSVNVGGTMQLSVFPNPGSVSQLKVNIANTDDAPVLIVLLDLNGTMLYSNIHYLDKNSPVLSVNELYTNLSPGIYYISASSNDLLVKRKIVVY